MKYFKIPLALVAGFALGLTAILHFSHSDGNPVAAHFTYERLFDYRAYSQFSGATDGVVSGKGYAAARNHILKFYEFFKYTYPILPVCIALLLVSLLTKVAPMRIVHSLFWLITGLGMCNVSGFRYYSENYWIFSDLFFLTAAMLLIAGIGDRTRPWFRAVLYVVAALFLSCFQYTQIDKAYPGYNGGMRDHLDEAWAGIYPNPDLEKLTKARYGDNATFMARVILDPRLNGSDRGIHLLEKGRVVNLIKNSPELREKLKKGLPDLIKSYGGSGRP
ncbi:MAG: hypothetical protein JNM63_08410 [Spirochaetia bacterium]|nr:hypothetical protein [Spirochaetia bacterium]